MDVEKIRELRLAYPFRQFYILFKDGHRVLVDEPYHLAIAVDGSHLLVSPSGRTTERFTIDRVRDVEVLSQRVA